MPGTYIESQHFRELLDRPVWVLDGGSRGEVFAPFDALDAEIGVIRFDPTVEASAGSTISKALWKSSGPIDFHVGEGREVSSVYPPNLELLRLFPDSVGTSGRATETVARIEAVSIDDAVAQGLCAAPDFIKLDVHSAEYEALEGAEASLGQVVGVLVETWHSPIHMGQHLHGDIERLLNECGFHLFDLCTAAAWRHTLDGDAIDNDRPRLIASESLLFKDFGDEGARGISFHTAMCAIAIADLYDYTNYAVRLSRRFVEVGPLERDVQGEIERTLVDLRAQRAHPAPSVPRAGARERVRQALRALRGDVPHRAAPTPPLETGIQRLSRDTRTPDA